MKKCRLSVALVLLVASTTAYADCPANSTDPKCRAEKQAQQKAQQETQKKAQQAAQQKAQQETQKKAQQETQQKTKQEAQQRAQQQQAQQKSQQQAQQKAQQEAQQRAQQQAKQKAQQQQAQQKAQQETQQRAQQQAQQKAQQETQQRTQQQAQQKAQQEAQQRGRQATQQRPGQEPGKQATHQRPGQEPGRQATQQRPGQEPGKQATHQRPGQEPGRQAVQQQGAQPNQGGRRLSQNQTQPMRPPQPPAFAAPSRHVGNAAGQHSTPAAPQKRVTVNAATTVVPHPNRSGYTVDRRNPDGSKLVVNHTARPNGRYGVVAYKQIDDHRTGASTRIYTDGHRETVGRNFVSRASPGGPNFVRYHDGLRAASLANGRPIYRERFVRETGRDGHSHQVIHRTAYVSVVHGRYVPHRTPVVQVYDVVPMYRAPMYVYRPARYRPSFFASFYIPLTAALVIAAGSSLYPPSVAAFEQPMGSYSDPMALMGDLQIAGALSDGYASMQDMPQSGESTYLTQVEGYAPPPDSAELAALRNQVEELQQQVATQANGNAELNAALPGAGLQATNYGIQDDVAGASPKTPIQIPEYARQQIRKQVRLNVAQHQNERPLLLSNIVESDYAKIYIFQAAAPLDVFDVNTAEQCTLSGGDLIGFSQVPRENAQDAGSIEVAQMKVIASRPGDCRANQVVEVNLVELQEMLNAFSQRVENNMKSLDLCSSNPNACTRS